MWSQLDDLAREPIKMLPKEMTGRLLPLAPNDILDCIPLTNTTHTHWTETELGFLAYFGNKIISHFFGYYTFYILFLLSYLVVFSLQRPHPWPLCPNFGMKTHFWVRHSMICSNISLKILSFLSYF
jgi:hypothetical protein